MTDNCQRNTKVCNDCKYIYLEKEDEWELTKCNFENLNEYFLDTYDCPAGIIQIFKPDKFGCTLWESKIRNNHEKK